MKIDILLVDLAFLCLAFIFTNTYFGSGYVVFKLGAGWHFLDYLRLLILLFIICGVTIAAWSLFAKGWNTSSVVFSLFFSIALAFYLYYLHSHLTFWDTAYFFASGPTGNKCTLINPKDGITLMTFRNLKYLWWTLAVISAVVLVGMKVRQPANGG